MNPQRCKFRRQPSNLRKCHLKIVLISPTANSYTANKDSQLPINYASLGVPRVINVAGNMTFLGGSIMPPEVVTAWTEASTAFVDLADLQRKAGERIASLLGVEAALVTSGAAGAILLGVAASVTGTDEKRIAQLPDTTGLSNEVILQRTHHSEYDPQLLTPGTKLIDVETSEDLEHAITPHTALMFYANYAAASGEISKAEWLQVARRHNIPTMIDISADIPPLERIKEYRQQGFDLLAVSGGKALRGPNDTGLLLGRPELIEAARRNTSPYEPTIGRVMKVGKEDTMALLAAVERFVSVDQQAETKEIHRRIDVIEQGLKQFPALSFERIIPEVANHQPHLIIDWDESKTGFSVTQVRQKLKDGQPSIITSRVVGTGNKGLLIAVLALQPGEEQIVAERLQAIFLELQKR